MHMGAPVQLSLYIALYTWLIPVSLSRVDECSCVEPGLWLSTGTERGPELRAQCQGIPGCSLGRARKGLTAELGLGSCHPCDQWGLVVRTPPPGQPGAAPAE